MRSINNYENKHVVILSAFVSDETRERNLDRHDNLQMDLITSNYQYKIVNGAYKGQDEVSMVVTLQDESEVRDLLSLANHYNQDSILVLKPYTREAILLFTNGQRDSLGTFQPCTEHEAKQREGFTYCPKNDQYYIVR